MKKGGRAAPRFRAPVRDLAIVKLAQGVAQHAISPALTDCHRTRKRDREFGHGVLGL